jgi:hypothetical protein
MPPDPAGPLRAAGAGLALAALSAGAQAHETALPGVDDSRRAAAVFADVAAAIAAGYEPLFDCTEHGTHGAMGQHYIHPGRARDGRLVLEEPDVLMYEPQPDGALQLVALEYVVFEAAWEGETPPSILGQELQRREAVGRQPVDPFWQLHVWHWRHNPGGLFADFNPYVTCAHAQ